ncbi:MAG: hypothetical protein HYV97_10330 [Bdellovibrio sp.]|nr:hypothetical protein [Bdellovibrio sp.]
MTTSNHHSSVFFCRFSVMWFLAMLLFLAACDRPPTYEHPSKGGKEFTVDSRECEQEAQRVYPDTGGLVGIGKKSEFVKQCLLDKGWISKQV